jgi:L-amino acid N-acyltransferase YncA
MLIRPATPQDIPEITALYAHHVTHGTASFEYEPPSEAEMLARFEKVMALNNPYFVAQKDGIILGYSYAGPYHARFAYRFTCENSIYIRHDAQGQGVGRALLQELLKACEAKGYRQMVAVIGDINNAASIGLHRALGFHHQGTLPATGWKHGRWLDTVFMQRALGEGETTAAI